MACVDVETTGLSSDDKIVEIAVTCIDNRAITTTFSTLVNPGIPVGASAGIHHLTDADLADAPAFSDILGPLTAVLTGRVLVSHNKRFDERFTRSAYAAAGYALPANVTWLCTLEGARFRLDKQSTYRLGALAALFAICNPMEHAAAGDTFVTAKLFLELLARADPISVPDPAVVHWPVIPANPGHPIKPRLLPSAAC